MSLIYLDRVPGIYRSEFESKVRIISRNLGFDPNWLMALMYFESRLRPDEESNISNATGLIQFMPETAIGLGTTVSKLKKMNHIQQLPFVEKYLSPYKGKFKSAVDLYLSVIFPLAIGKPKNFILQSKKLSKEIIAKQNPIFNKNRDDVITKKEVIEEYTNWFPKDIAKKIFNKNTTPVFIIGISIISYLGYRFWSKKRALNSGF